MPRQAPLSEEQLDFLMRDERWWHPRKRDADWQRMIVQGFERLYPASEAPQGEGGAVHVDAYARRRDGKQESVSEHFRGRPGGAGQKQPLPAADRDNVSATALFAAVDFDPNGLTEKQLAVLHPADAAAGWLLAKWNQGLVAAASDYQAGDNEWDAVRHAAWSFAMTQSLGRGRAKEFGDAHERQDYGSEGSRMMDLYNNHVGRELGHDPANVGRDPIEAAKDAARNGRLRLRPYPESRP